MQDDTSDNLDLNKRQMHSRKYNAPSPSDGGNVGSVARTGKSKAIATANFKTQKI